MLRTERFHKRDYFALSGETVESQYTATFDSKKYAVVLDIIQVGLVPQTLTGL
jgi:hypothetical protein